MPVEFVRARKPERGRVRQTGSQSAPSAALGHRVAGQGRDRAQRSSVVGCGKRWSGVPVTGAGNIQGNFAWRMGRRVRAKRTPRRGTSAWTCCCLRMRGNGAQSTAPSEGPRHPMRLGADGRRASASGSGGRSIGCAPRGELDIRPHGPRAVGGRMDRGLGFESRWRAGDKIAAGQKTWRDARLATPGGRMLCYRGNVAATLTRAEGCPRG